MKIDQIWEFANFDLEINVWDILDTLSKAESGVDFVTSFIWS